MAAKKNKIDSSSCFNPWFGDQEEKNDSHTKNVFLQKTRKTRILIIAMAGGLYTH